jgi:glycosyltransferase involved in cell wall biosynthesis
MRVYLNIRKENAEKTTGIGQVVLAQYALLPKLGIETVTDPDRADVTAAHIENGELSRIDVLHCHGLYFSDVPHLPYAGWHTSVNARIAATARRAAKITVPSNWVAEPFRRDMRIEPAVIGHGINLGDWKRSKKPGGFVYYNKNRESDVCTSRWAYELAKRGNNVVSTFMPRGEVSHRNMAVTGPVAHREVIQMMSEAGIYLATTLETFGIGTVEALAAGVPVLGFNWGGNADIVQHKENGYLVDPEDANGLIEGIDYIRRNWPRLSSAALESAKRYDWSNVIGQYAELYQAALTSRLEDEKSGVSVVITNYNYGKWVSDAINSALAQEVPCEVIVVDDGSTDNSREVISGYGEQVRAIFQENSGVAEARNAGIAAAKNEFVILLDADDRIDPAFSRILLGEMRRDRGLGIVYTGLNLMDAEGLDYAHADWPPEFDWNVQSKYNVPPSNCIPSACMIRRGMWRRAGGILQRFAPGEDAEFWTRGLSVGYDAKRATFEGLFHYRNHGSGASKTRKYIATDAYSPYLHDGDHPFAAPLRGKGVEVRSYLNPAVSVIIPVGPGHRDIVSEAILSVTGQSLREWEVIVVNDSGESLEKLRESYPFIKVLDTPGSKGAGHARNMGVDAARGPVVVFLDADDTLMPKALEKMLGAFVGANGRYIYTDWLADTGATLETRESKPYNQSEWRMFHAVTVMMSTAQARQIRFDEDLPGWEDWEFFIKAAIYGFCGERLAEPLMVYRMNTGSRREIMLENGSMSPAGKQALENIRGKYAEFYTGVKKMAGCCGGDSAVIAAKRILSAQSRAEPQAASVSVAADSGSTPLTYRMEYIGANIGEISFHANGRIYRGGNNPLHKYKDVPAEDAKVLEATGRWRRIALPQAPVMPAPVEPQRPPEINDDLEKKAQELIDRMLSEKPAAQAMAVAEPLTELEEISEEMEAKAAEAIKSLETQAPAQPKPMAKAREVRRKK